MKRLCIARTENTNRETENEIDENRNNLQIIEEKGERESANGEN